MTSDEPRVPHATQGTGADVRVLLVGPYDPTCGEYTFLAPPLGVWRLCGVLAASGVRARVFDPNAEAEPMSVFPSVLTEEPWDVIGFSTTGMTLRYDLGLAHAARRLRPESLLVAGGMEATFDPALVLRLAPFDLCVLGEGEGPLLEIAARIRSRASLAGIAGTAWLSPDGRLERRPRPALTREELRDAIFLTPYEEMPYGRYWKRLEESYRVGSLPVKADREARLAEIRSVRLITLNYCPMRCSFCSSTNFLDAAQDATTKIARLSAEECLDMVRRILSAHPGTRTVIFQDDIFVFSSDRRVLPLCEGLVAAKAKGDLPPDLQFISTNRIDAMTPERLSAMKRAGFRVLGFGVESFSQRVLTEFNKARIHPLIRTVLETALSLGITPFLDIILTSPRSCRVEDLAETLREAYRWTVAGCEVGMYPYVIPFSGAAMASDPTLKPHTLTARRRVEGTGVEWDQPAKIPPLDPGVREAILAIEAEHERCLSILQRDVAHLPSRVRSLLLVAAAAPILEALGERMPPRGEVVSQLARRLPGLGARGETYLRRLLSMPAREPVGFPRRKHPLEDTLVVGHAAPVEGVAG